MSKMLTKMGSIIDYKCGIPQDNKDIEVLYQLT